LNTPRKKEKNKKRRKGRKRNVVPEYFNCSVFILQKLPPIFQGGKIGSILLAIDLIKN